MKNEAFAAEKHPYLKLFLSMLEISAFTFGGGFVIISMMRKRYAREYRWLNDQEVLDMTAIAQSAPGALGVNSAIIFGYRIAGLPGVFLSLLATVIPPVVIISLITFFYERFVNNEVANIVLQVMRAGVAAVIADVVIDLGKAVFETKNLLNIALMLAAFFALSVFKVSSLWIIAAALVLGIASSLKGGKQ
ncbi:MAG: chromate transporter [Erysipelotrichaceae bacterium]|nr:chromate transporter [Erysipelotrichaceae bacterium]